MACIGLKIKRLMSEKNIDAPTLAKKMNKTKQAVYYLLEKKDVSTSVLWELAKIFEVPVTFFLTEENEEATATAGNGGVAVANGTAHHITTNAAPPADSATAARIQALEALLAEKERLITVLLADRDKYFKT